MPRKAAIWRRKQDGFFYVTIRKKKIRLSKDKKEAQQAFHTLLSKERDPLEKAGLSPTFKRLADLFLDEGLRTKAVGTYAVQQNYLQLFCNFIGTKRAGEVKVHHVTEWLHTHEAWSESTRTTARSILRACMNWGVQQGYLREHPLAKLKRGEYTNRKRTLTADERQKILKATEGVGDIHDFLFAIIQTGARPFSELAKITADMIDWQTKTIVYQEHKNAKKGKRRTIYLTDAMVDMLRRRSKAIPEGLLFKTKYGNPWSAQNTAKWTKKLAIDLKLKPFSVYAIRHSIITDSLVSGMTSDIVAELMGNSPTTIARNYSHLECHPAAMRAAAERAAASAT